MAKKRKRQQTEKHTQIKRGFDRNFTANQTTRRRAADDRVFARVTQWDDALLQNIELAYRGEFNIIRKGCRHIIAELRANPVQVDFEPMNQDREDGADLLDGLYLTDDRRNSSIESYDNASMEAVECGVGGWELFTEYESSRTGKKHQVIRRRPIYEANNVSFPDSNAKAQDKSDSMNWGLLDPYSVEGYCDLVKDLTGEDLDPDDVTLTDFASPEQSYTFPWMDGQQELIYVCRWYERELVKDKVLTMEDVQGNQFMVWDSQIFEVMDELLDGGYTIIKETEAERYQVKLYWVDGKGILDEYVIAGEHIPIVHTYGERTFVEGEEIWEGCVRLAKDPQRLRNFLMSYLSEITTRSPRPKPMFTPAEIAGHEWMYETAGPDNHYPYYFYNATTPKGEEIVTSREAMPVAQMPAGIEQLAAESRQAVDDVVNPGLPDEFADTDLSGYAIEQLTARYDQQSLVYQQNMKHAKRWDAVIYAGMATVIYDAPRTATVTGRDGQRTQKEIMSTVLDRQTGEMKVVNDLTNQEFEVFAEIGQSYSSKRERTREHLENLAEKVAQIDPNLAKILTMMALTLVDGVGMDSLRDYLRNQLLRMGVLQPENEEEMQMVMDAQQNQQPDAATLLAQAEILKGQADQMNAQTKQIEAGVKQFDAETKRIDVMSSAQEKGYRSRELQARAGKLQADTMKTIRESLRGTGKAANDSSSGRRTA